MRIIVGLLVGLLFFTACGEPEPNHEQSYIESVHKLVPVTKHMEDSKLLDLGYQVCDDFKTLEPITDQDILNYARGMVQGSQGSLTAYDAGAIIGSAGYGLCPEVLKEPLDNVDTQGT